MSLTKSLPACLALSFASFAAHAADGPPPPSVSQPSGINLGGTSFYDGQVRQAQGPEPWFQLLLLEPLLGSELDAGTALGGELETALSLIAIVSRSHELPERYLWQAKPPLAFALSLY